MFQFVGINFKFTKRQTRVEKVDQLNLKTNLNRIFSIFYLLNMHLCVCVYIDANRCFIRLHIITIYRGAVKILLKEILQTSVLEDEEGRPLINLIKLMFLTNFVNNNYKTIS